MTSMLGARSPPSASTPRSSRPPNASPLVQRPTPLPWAACPSQVRLLLRCAEAQDILLQRPSTPAKPQGPVVKRPTGARLPPAVRAATSNVYRSDR